MSKWPTLSLKKPQSPEKTTTEISPEGAPISAAEEAPPIVTSAVEGSPPQAPTNTSPQDQKKLSKRKLRKLWYSRLREGDLQHLAPVIAQDLPLMIGAETALTNRLQKHEELNYMRLKKIVSMVLEYHVHQKRYLQACLEQEFRYDLDGNPKEPMLEKGRQYAREWLEKLAKKESSQNP